MLLIMFGTRIAKCSSAEGSYMSACQPYTVQARCPFDKLWFSSSTCSGTLPIEVYLPGFLCLFWAIVVYSSSCGCPYLYN